MIEYTEPIITETITSRDGRFRIEGQVVAGIRQSYIPSEWKATPSYGYYPFTNERGTVAFRTVEECKSFFDGILASEKDSA